MMRGRAALGRAVLRRAVSGRARLGRAVLGVAVVTLVLAASCGDDSNGAAFLDSVRVGPDAIAGGAPRTPETADEVASEAVIEVERYWEEQYPQIYGEPFEPLADGFHPYDSRNLPPGCGPDAPTYIPENAYYCPPYPGAEDGDYVAWDTERLLPWLERDFGLYTVALVLAHEFGHAVQYRDGVFLGDTPSVVLEMQADCFAGAWTRWVADGNSEVFGVGESTLNLALAGLVAFRDEPGFVGASDFGAHGSGFDRVTAFQDGFENRAEHCAQYPDLTVGQSGTELIVTQFEFTPDDFATGGDLQLEDVGQDAGVYTLADDSLDVFYDRLFTENFGQSWSPVGDLVVVDPSRDQVTCEGDAVSGDALEGVSHYCAAENVVLVDGVNVVGELYELGDFAVVSELARLWAVAAQNQLGILPSVEASLQADCLTGVYAEALWFGRGEVGARLSPGDLDEAILAMLASADEVRAESGSAFQRVAAMRDGFLEGIASCEEYHSF